MWTGRKEPFGHTSRLEPQPRGAVTRRAVAQRRSRASGLTRPLAEAIWVPVWVVWILSRFPRSAAVCRKSLVFSSLPIRKVLVLCFTGGVSPSLGWFLFFERVIHSCSRSYYLFFTTCSLLLV